MAGPKATVDILKIQKLISEGKTQKEICDQVGLGPKRLQKFCYIYDIKGLPSKKKHENHERIKSILQLTDQGYSRDEIANKFDIKLESLQEWCCRNQVPLPPRATIFDSKNSSNIIVKTSLPKELVEELMQEARVRNLGVVTFTSSLLAAISSGKLYNAVLDQ